LKVAAGWPICRVAASGLKSPYHEDTVRSWLNRYEQEGLAGLRVKQGRGRKPVFFPLCMTVSKLLHPSLLVGSIAHRVCMALSRVGFPLQGLQGQVDWLQHTHTGKPMSLPGICKLLKRLAVSSKRGRAHLHSPDLLYNKKMAYIRSLHELHHTDPERYVLLYEDELTYYRRAVVNRGWAGTGQRMAIKVKEANLV
jgi:hypothetical protein